MIFRFDTALLVLIVIDIARRKLLCRSPTCGISR